MLEVKSVTKKYRKLVACDDINFSVNDSEISILLGPNGAGKSTIVKCITGLLRFDGEITIGGYDNRTVQAKKLLGYIPEMPCIYDAITVDEHIEFIMRAYNCNDRKYADELIERFELSDKKTKLGKELSKGMQQKLSICCALVHKPSVIIFDEPMVGLDPHAIKELKLIFNELKNNGASILISTHMIDSVENYWDCANIMVNGKFVATTYNKPGSESLEKLFFDVTERDGDKA